jgi:hypothetical protein
MIVNHESDSQSHAHPPDRPVTAQHSTVTRPGTRTTIRLRLGDEQKRRGISVTTLVLITKSTQPSALGLGMVGAHLASPW